MKDQEFIVQKIRTQYTQNRHTELEELMALDARVKRPVLVFAYTFGSVSAIILGAGMSLVMTELGNLLGMQETLVPGILIGIVGLILTLLTYPIYKRLLNRRRKKYAQQIIALSDKLRKNGV